MPRIGFAATAATWTAVVAIATMVAAWSLVSREGGTQAPLLVGVRGARSAFAASPPVDAITRDLEACVAKTERHLAHQRAAGEADGPACVGDASAAPDDAGAIEADARAIYGDVEAVLALCARCAALAARGAPLNATGAPPTPAAVRVRLLRASLRAVAALKKRAFCHYVRRTLAAHDPDGRALAVLHRSELLLLGSGARGECSVSSDIDAGLLIDGDDAGADAAAIVAPFFSALRRDGKTLEGTDGPRRHACFPANIGAFLSPASALFVGPPQSLARRQVTLTPEDAEVYTAMAMLYSERARVRGGDAPEAVRVQQMRRRTHSMAANLCVYAPWSWTRRKGAGRYHDALCGGWDAMEEPSPGASGGEVPHKMAAAVRELAAGRDILASLVRESREARAFAPKYAIASMRILVMVVSHSPIFRLRTHTRTHARV